ncbi:hypothetical protein LGM54_30510 [Burkholderia cenocepacia]|uniref:hypothetical protein n=1 Tax=Burkholderia cenocepacia TaxID=95486 RepID=UPI001CF5AE97|nr:hypothetical protein [Burkholderia cenocepacia]MCA7967318.1 hypothetical protein [Burkholderia cenocepacia]
MRARFFFAIGAALACNLAHAGPLTLDETMTARRALDNVQTLEARTAQQPDVRAWLLDQISTARASLETVPRPEAKQRLLDVAIRAHVAAMLLDAPALVPAAAIVDSLAHGL